MLIANLTMTVALTVTRTSKSLTPDRLKTGAWTLVLRGRYSGFDVGSAAMERLCVAYAPAVEAFLLRLKGDHHWARCRTEEFVAHLSKGNGLRYMLPERSLFRDYLIEALRTYFAENWKKEVSPLESTDSSELYEAAKFYRRVWALTSIERSLKQMEADAQRSESPELYFAICDYLSGAREIPFGTFKEKFRLSEGATRLALLRLRLRFGEFLRAEIRETVRGDELVCSEIRSLREFAR